MARKKYTYGRRFKHPRIFGLVCYRYTNGRKSTKTLVMDATKKVVPAKDYK